MIENVFGRKHSRRKVRSYHVRSCKDNADYNDRAICAYLNGGGVRRSRDSMLSTSSLSLSSSEAESDSGEITALPKKLLEAGHP